MILAQPVNTSTQAPQFSGIFNSQTRTETKQQQQALKDLLAETQDVFAKETEIKTLQAKIDELMASYLEKAEAVEQAEGDIDTEIAKGEAAKIEKELNEVETKITELETEIKANEPKLSDEEKELLANVDEKKLEKHLKKLVKGQNAKRNGPINSWLGAFGPTAAVFATGVLLFPPFAAITSTMVALAAGVGFFMIYADGGLRDFYSEQQQARALKVRLINELVQEGVIDMATVEKLQKSTEEA